MRLLHTKRPGLEFEEFQGEEIPSYAILSHTWYSNEEEVSYQDVCNGKGQDRPGYEKILKCKLLATDFDYFWVDTCCIDKTSSAELSEAINSMYMWYTKASVCYAYLSDVSSEDPIESITESRWFTRGWTLQELIAPATVVFYSKEWKVLSEKREIADTINNVTGIPRKLLLGRTGPFEFSVAERMSWASGRTTSRIEDEAYSLMGIFEVNMPLLYGEKYKAFQRLQEEIMKTTDDQSLFAWTDPGIKERQLTGLLALRPKAFARSRNIISMGIWGKGNVLGKTNRGIRVKLYLIPGKGDDPRDLAASLDCWTDSRRTRTAIILLRSLVRGGAASISADQTQFARMHMSVGLGLGRTGNKIGGEYREVYVRDMEMAPSRLSLEIYNRTSGHIRIQDPGRPFSVHPVSCWEPQTGIFTVPGDSNGTFAAICVPSDECSYITYLGRATESRFWVKTEMQINVTHLTDTDIWKGYVPVGNESSTSVALFRSSNPQNSYTERCTVKLGAVALYSVVIYEINMVLDRLVPNRDS